MPKADKSEFPSWILLPLLVPTIVDYLNSADAPPLLVEAADRVARGDEALPEFSDLPEELKWNEDARMAWMVATFALPKELTITCRMKLPSGEPEVSAPTSEFRAWAWFILIACQAFGRKGALNLRRCRYEECKRFFLDDKNKGKLACSHECSTLARSQIYYDKLKANPRALERYRKNMRELMKERWKARRGRRRPV